MNASTKGSPGPLDTALLPVGVRSRIVAGVNGLTMHVLEAGYEPPGRPVRAAAARLSRARLQLAQGDAAAGGRRLPRDGAGPARLRPHDAAGTATTTATSRSFRILNLVRDVARRCVGAGLSLGGRRGRARLRLAGGGVVRAGAARRVPLGGADERAVRAARRAAVRHRAHGPRAGATGARASDDELARARRRRASTTSWYYSTRAANDEHAQGCPQGLHAFLRAYYHHKSADWTRTRPYPLAAWTAGELAQAADLLRHGPRQGMAETVAPHMPTAAAGRGVQVADRGASWPSTRRSTRAPASRAGSSGTACGTSPRLSTPSCRLFAGRTIDVPATLHRGQERLGRLPGAGRASSACRRAACTRLAAARTSSTAPGTGCSRSSPRPRPPAAGVPRQAALSAAAAGRTQSAFAGAIGNWPHLIGPGTGPIPGRRAIKCAEVDALAATSPVVPGWPR